MNTHTLAVAVVQPKAVYQDTSITSELMRHSLQSAESEKVDILCFPECFLQGYLLDETEAQIASLDVSSSTARTLFSSLHSESVTLIFGLIENENGDLFNTAVVVENGKLVGKYRKHHLLQKENFFTPGKDFPVFVKNGVTYGINICYDARFPESAEPLVRQGAKIIFCPLNNSLPHEKAVEWKTKHFEVLSTHAQTNHCWLVASDVVESSETRTSFGGSCLVDQDGKIVTRFNTSEVGIFVKTIEINLNNE